MHIVGTDEITVAAGSTAPAGHRHAVDSFGRVLCRSTRARFTWPGLSWSPADASPYGVYWPALVPSELVEHRVVIGGQTIPVPPVAVPPHGIEAPVPALEVPPAPSGPTERVPLGRVFGARSGDKGGNANVGVWARSGPAYAWLERELGVERFRALVPEAAGLVVERHALPNLWSLNFVVHGLLGDGVASSTRSDPQAKSLGEYLRARLIDVPRALLGA